MLFQLGEKTPKIFKDCFVAPSSSLIGEVIMEKEASVWFNVVIRADNAAITVGSGSNVQDGSILHVDHGFPLTIGKGVTVGHKVMLHGCTIGDNCLIGMNAVILNGAKIGANCIIAANALITEGTEIPDGHMAIGSPAKIIKPLTDKHKEMISQGAKHYTDNAETYKTELKPIQHHNES